jgi:hypothetical protein
MCELYLNQGVKKKKRMNWMLVTHSRHPSDSGGRDQEDCGSKPAWTNSSQDTILIKTHHRKGLVEWFKV